MKEKSNFLDGIHPLLIEILKKRGYASPEVIADFLQPDYINHSYDPMLLKDMRTAIIRIKLAIDHKESIGIYGDYDIDGLTATVLLHDYLTSVGIRVLTYIPDRFEEGYGLSADGLEALQKQGAQLIISVDCGTTSYEALDWAGKNKLDVIVTDHHEPKADGGLPKAIAVINPKRVDDKYPFKDLAGVGVAFKLVQALQQDLPDGVRLTDGQEKWLLDLVALGTVCDVVNLIDENRMFVHFGLKVLRKTKRIGLVKLADHSDLDLKKIDTYHLGFVIGPRLNAAGRLTHAKSALKLLMTTNKEVASKQAELLNDLNRKRRQDQEKIMQEASLEAQNHVNDSVLVLADPAWSHGIVGIVASKMVEGFKKPTLLLQILGETAKGSARSFGDYNIVDALNFASDLLIKFGGHSAAAGATLKTENIPLLRDRLNEYYRTLKLKSQTSYLDPIVDVESTDLANFNWGLLDAIKQLAPFGRGNLRPLFLCQTLKIKDFKVVGANGKHLKLLLSDSGGQVIDGIGFNLAEQHSNLTEGANIKVCFELEENNFKNQNNLQLIVRKLEQI
jgi:single-stranded-DNA-specific exonuclease